MGQRRVTLAECHRIVRAVEEGAATQEEIANAWGLSQTHVSRIYRQYRTSRPLELNDAKTHAMLAEWRRECQLEARQWAERQRQPVELRPKLPEAHGIHGKRRIK